MTRRLPIPPNDEMAVTPATYARSVSTKRQEALTADGEPVGRFSFHEMRLADHHPCFSVIIHLRDSNSLPHRNLSSTAIQTP